MLQHCNLLNPLAINHKLEASSRFRAEMQSLLVACEE